MSDPAPPPCEACESHDRKCKSQCSIDRMTHHAEIAELRAILWQIATDPLQQAELREAVAAALAPKEGK